MARKIKYYLVAAEALPEIFIRVAEAKRMMQTGEADTVGAATKMAGISRSAFYKYKDDILPFSDNTRVKTVTLVTQMMDEPGLLSDLLHIVADDQCKVQSCCTVLGGAFLDCLDNDLIFTLGNQVKAADFCVIC